MIYLRVLLLPIIFTMLSCSAMNKKSVILPRTKEPAINFCLTLPTDLIKEIHRYSTQPTDLKRTIFLENAQLLENGIKMINSLAFINKQAHTIIDEDTDNLIKLVSATFKVANAFVAKAIKTEAAARRYRCQTELLQLCLHPMKKNIFMEKMRELSTRTPITIDWNFTYPYTCCLGSVNEI